MKGHLSDETLALLAGGELTGFAAWRARRHVGRCEICRLVLEEMEVVRGSFRNAAEELPPGVNWTRLSREMQANIRVGLEASECVAPVAPKAEPLGWRPAVALASLMIVVVTGWYLNASRLVPKPFASVKGEPAADAASVELTPTGVELRQGSQGFALLNPRANRVTYSVGSASAQARYVDVETGQVTITQVTLSSAEN